MESAAAHVHRALAGGELPESVLGLERVRELEPEAHSPARRPSAQGFDQAQGGAVLQVVSEGLPGHASLVAEHVVEDPAHLRRAEQGGVELDGGVEPPLLDQVRRDALDLLRRAAVHRGERHRTGDAGGDVEAPGLREDARRRGRRGLEVPRGIRHAVEKALHARREDAAEIVADAHGEGSAGPRPGVAERRAQDVDEQPGVRVLPQRLLERQLLRPLAVVALVLGSDAGPGHADVVPGLHRLELDRAGAHEPGRDDVLRHLRVRARGDADRRLEGPAGRGETEGVARVGGKEERPAQTQRGGVRLPPELGLEQPCEALEARRVGGAHPCRPYLPAIVSAMTALAVWSRFSASS